MLHIACFENQTHRFNFRFPLANFYQINELQMSTECLSQPNISNQTQAIQSEIHSLHSELKFCPYAGYSSQLYSTLSHRGWNTVYSFSLSLVSHCIYSCLQCTYAYMNTKVDFEVWST